MVFNRRDYDRMQRVKVRLCMLEPEIFQVFLRLRLDYRCWETLLLFCCVRVWGVRRAHDGKCRTCDKDNTESLNHRRSSHDVNVYINGTVCPFDLSTSHQTACVYNMSNFWNHLRWKHERTNGFLIPAQWPTSSLLIHNANASFLEIHWKESDQFLKQV